MMQMTQPLFGPYESIDSFASFGRVQKPPQSVAMTPASEANPGIRQPAFLSRRDVSTLFGVSASTVTRWARQGLLKTVRTPGGHYRFPAEETRRAAGRGASGDGTPPGS